MGSPVHGFFHIVPYVHPVAAEHHPVPLKASGNIASPDEGAAGKVESGGKAFQKGAHIFLCHCVHALNIRIIRRGINGADTFYPLFLAFLAGLAFGGGLTRSFAPVNTIIVDAASRYFERPSRSKKVERGGFYGE
jgi:hypothetical protein